MKTFHLVEYCELRGPGTKKTVFFFATLLFIYSLAIYSKSLQNEFVWDSVGSILQDPLIRDFGNIPVFFLTPLHLGKSGNLGDGLHVSVIQYYRPLLSTLHTFEYSLFGDSPVGYKAVSLLFNGLVVVLGFLIIRRLTLSITLAFLASLIYASTLARAEAVYWVYSDSHIFSALFALSAFWAYLNGRSWLALSFLVCGLLFQEGLVFFPLLLVAYEGTCNSAESVLNRIRRVVPFGLVVLIYLVARHFIVGGLPSSSLSVWSLLKAAGYQSWEHMRIFLFPDGPATVYLYREGMFNSGEVASNTGLVALVFLIVIALGLWRLRKGDCFWYLWFLVWVLVSFNIGAYGEYLMAEKTLYLASLGLSVLLVQLLLFAKRLRPVGLILVSSIFLFNSVQIYKRADSWVDTTTYVEKLLEFEPEFYLALTQAGNGAYDTGRYQAATRYYLKLFHLKPNLVQSVGKTYLASVLYLAEELTIAGKHERAIGELNQATIVMGDNARIYNGMGIVYYYSGDFRLAKRNWMLALRLDPGNEAVRKNLEMLNKSP